MLHGLSMKITEHPIKKFIKRKGMTVQEFAQLAGLSRSQVHCIMRGMGSKKKTFERISAATCGAVTVVELFKCIE